MKSLVKWFNDEKGFGFIEGLNEDIFVHYSSIKSNKYRSLYKEQVVSFGIIKTSKGLMAVNVVVEE